jgi:hypothetical protein
MTTALSFTRCLTSRARIESVHRLCMKSAAKVWTCDARGGTVFGEGTPDNQAAEAFIFERTGKVTKTHKGAHAEFARLAVNESRIDVELRRFLPRAYDLKAICDYEPGPDAVVPHEKADAAIQTATSFVDCIARLLAASGQRFS